MTKESLMEMGLTEEQAGKVMEGLNGAFVTKTRFNEVNTELANARKTVTDRDGQIEQLKKSAGDNQTLKEQIEQLQAANETQKQAHEAQLKEIRISNAVDLALTGAKAKNNVAARALLQEFLKTAQLQEDGTVKGLDAQVKKLAEAEDTAFLFERAPDKKFKGAKPGEKGDPGSAGDMTLERFRAMSGQERRKFYVDHPEEYKALYGGTE